MFTLQSPLKPDWTEIIQINQEFGANQVDFYKKLNLAGHNGIDFYTHHYEMNGKSGEGPVLAAHDGYVISNATTQSDTAGRFVRLETDEIEIDGRPCKVQTVYFHLKSCRVSNSDNLTEPKNRDKYNQDRHPGKHWVRAGSEIGISDNTGQYTTGAHLHFGMYILWKRSNGVFSMDSQNGYGGAVNPMPFFKDDRCMQHLLGLFDSRFWKNGKAFVRKDLEKMLGPEMMARRNAYLEQYAKNKKFLFELMDKFKKRLIK